MRRVITGVGVFGMLLSLASSTLGKDNNPKPGPLTGTWECMSHGAPQGDMPFTLYLEHASENITGSVSSPIGGTQITSGTFKQKTLQIRIDTPQGAYMLTGKLVNKHQLQGEWSHNPSEKGTWEGKRQAPANR